MGLIRKVLCSVGIHKWEDKKAMTLRCTCCDRIDCRWANGLIQGGLDKKLAEINKKAKELDDVE